MMIKQFYASLLAVLSNPFGQVALMLPAQTFEQCPAILTSFTSDQLIGHVHRRRRL
jgi:hypothetical protein